jgi:hypothetical protein
MLTTSMDALPASATAAVAAAAATAAGNSSGGGSSGSNDGSSAQQLFSHGSGGPMSPADVGLDPAAAAAVGACPYRQSEQQGIAADVAAAAVRQQPPLYRLDKPAAADAAVLIGDTTGDKSSSSSHSTGTGCGVGGEQQGDLQHAESLPYYCHVEACDAVGELPVLNREEIQRMSSCSSGSSLALMQQLVMEADAAAAGKAAAAAAASKAKSAAPAGCLEQ